MLDLNLNLTPLEILNIDEEKSSICSVPSPLINKIKFFDVDESCLEILKFKIDTSLLNPNNNCDKIIIKETIQNELKIMKKRGRPRQAPKQAVIREKNFIEGKSLLAKCKEFNIDIFFVETMKILDCEIKFIQGRSNFKLYNVIDLVTPFIIHRNNARRYVNKLTKDFERVQILRSSWTDYIGVRKIIRIAKAKSKRYDSEKIEYLNQLNALFN